MSLFARTSLFSAALFLAAPIQADHSWGGYHWARTGNPFFLQLGDNLSSTWKPILATTKADWNVSTVLQTEIVAGQTSPKTCKAITGKVQVCNSSYGKTGWLGIAQVWVSGLHIAKGTTKLNDSYFNSAPYNTTAWRNLVMCQEVGHTFGLGHQDENFDNANLNSCMDYTSDPSTNQHPNPHDYGQLETIYSHLDLTTSVASSPMPAAMNDIDFDGPGQWGRLVKSQRDGRLQTFEQDFGGGHKVVTFVIWAEPRGKAHEQQEPQE